MKPLNETWPVSQAVELACILEASAPKLGNVHPNLSFEDMHFGHFLASAVAIAPSFAAASRRGVGELVLEAATQTRRCAGCNTNLGTLLLLAPLAVAAAKVVDSGAVLSVESLTQATQEVLGKLSPQDSHHVYLAIRVASPGGLGKRDLHDVTSVPPEDLVSAMRQVADVDAVARQYVNGFEDVFQRLWPWLQEELARNGNPLRAIAKLQLRWLAWEPDGLIFRKLGETESSKVWRRAQKILELSRTDSADFQSEYIGLDAYLREDGNRRNPGTTADLIAASLFCQLVIHKTLT